MSTSEKNNSIGHALGVVLSFFGLVAATVFWFQHKNTPEAFFGFVVLAVLVIFSIVFRILRSFLQFLLLLGIIGVIFFWLKR